MQYLKKFLVLSFICYSSIASAQNKGSKYFKNWPKGTSPKEVGNKLAWRFNESPHTNFGKTAPPRFITYSENCTYYGSLTFAKETKDKALQKALVNRFEPFFSTKSKMIPRPDHVDYAVFAAVPLELYIITKDKRYYDMGIATADKQWGPPEGPRVVPESHKFYAMGYTWQTRLWIDDMYMITALQAQAYRASGDIKYIERAAKEMVFYLDELQRPNGLFYHAPDVPYFWGRGNGWMAAGMAELLSSLPKSNTHYPRILEGYKKMMASLLKYQAEDGMWRQLVDDAESWKETSGTGMFTFAMVTGVKNGWLDAKVYGPAARKAWITLVSYINKDGDVTEVCQGTNKKDDRQYYLDREKIIGDFHGQAPVLWTATALIK